MQGAALPGLATAAALLMPEHKQARNAEEMKTRESAEKEEEEEMKRKKGRQRKMGPLHSRIWPL